MPDLTPPRESPPAPSPAAEHFECDIRYGGRAAAWISPRGELDLATAPQVQQAVQEALSRALLIIVDLRQLTFIDSTGLQLLIETDARARRSDRRLTMVRGSAQIDRLFDLIGLSGRLDIVDLEPGLAPPPAIPAPADWPGVA